MIRIESIDVLPDDALLEIFGFHLNPPYRCKNDIEEWLLLVHVCRRWRNLVFGSPRHLNLQLYCTSKTPTRDKLDIWPTLPLVVMADRGDVTLSPGMDNIIAALGRSNRVCRVHFWNLAGWEQVLAPMYVPFPELTRMSLSSYKTAPVTPPVISDSFLGGSAPRLQYFTLSGITFPGLPHLLLSATHLVELCLSDIPHSGYISPEAMVALLSALSSLRTLTLGFKSPQSRPDLESRSLPPPKHSILPALRSFMFEGVVEYLEEFVNRIDAPEISTLHATYVNQVDFDFDTLQLVQFINRTPKLGKRDEAQVKFYSRSASIQLQYRTSTFDLSDSPITIFCVGPDRQLSSIERVCNSPLHSISMVEDLHIASYKRPDWKEDALEIPLWLQLLLPFTAVKKLYLSREGAPVIAFFLKELVESGITEVLPSLQNIFVEDLEPGPYQENIRQFVTARRLSDPLQVIDCDRYSM